MLTLHEHGVDLERAVAQLQRQVHARQHARQALHAPAQLMRRTLYTGGVVLN